MHTIDVDFEVFKQLTVRRATEDVSYNDVIRELLGFGKAEPRTEEKAAIVSEDDWVVKGVRFPATTEFRARHKGRPVTARVEGGALALNGKPYPTPSAAAFSITGNRVNGWLFWECKLPGKSTWQRMESFRK